MATKVFSSCRTIFGNRCMNYKVIFKNHKVFQRSQLIYPSATFCTSHPSDDVSVFYRSGLPVIEVQLPSRGDKCQFTLKPITHTLGDFIKQLKNEDGGIDRVAIYAMDDVRLANSTAVEVLLRSDFKLLINEKSFHVKPPEVEPLCHDDEQRLNRAKAVVAQLYNTLNIEEYQLEWEKQLQQTVEDVKVELEPYDKLKQQLAERAHKRTSYLAWVGLGFMGLQFGFLARLVWWEYSWDIMEPVTYFVTYGTSMAMFAYYVLTKQEYLFPDVRDRFFLQIFHKGARKRNLDVEKYNSLMNQLQQAELDLKRLRDPLQLNLPMTQLDSESKAE